MNISFCPYLNFQTSTRQAMEFYKSVFGGELTLSTFGESNQGSEDEKDLIVHATLKNNYFTLMASDGSHNHNVTMGDSVNLSLMGDDDVILFGFFNKLAEGGRIDMPLEKQFWGDSFGMLTDKFGMHWMVNISAPK